MSREPPPRSYTDDLEAPRAFRLEAIGTVRSPHRERHGTPRQASVAADPELRPYEEARVELFDEARAAEALRDLAAFDYAWIVAFLHLNQGWRPRVVPPRGPRVARGLYATRSPHRPNPIGLSAARILRVEGAVVVFERLDLLDGTPVLDIKPYVPSVDAFPEARAGWVDDLDDP